LCWKNQGEEVMLRFYVEVARTAFRRQVVYRWANLAGLLTNIVFGMIFSYVMIALYQVRSSAGGYDLIDALRYVWLVQSMVMIVMTFGWYDLMLTIRSGEVISDLSKPCDFYWYWFSREIGRSCYYLLYRGIPTYLAGMLLFRFGAPLDVRVWPIFLLSLSLGAMTGIAYRILFNIAAFWIIEARALGTLATVVALVFTGNYVPLPFFPGWLRAIADWLPFSGMMSVPAQVFLGKLIGLDLLINLIRQIGWLVLFIVLVRFVTIRAARRVVIQGG